MIAKKSVELMTEEGIEHVVVRVNNFDCVEIMPRSDVHVESSELIQNGDNCPCAYSGVCEKKNKQRPIEPLVIEQSF